MAESKRRYGCRPSRPDGNPERLAYCVEAIFFSAAMITQQCTRKRGHGPNGEYCKQHAAIVAERATRPKGDFD